MSKELNTLPCVNCITYAICKSSFNGSPATSILRLIAKCTILHAYLQYSEEKDDVIKGYFNTRRREEITTYLWNTI